MLVAITIGVAFAIAVAVGRFAVIAFTPATGAILVLVAVAIAQAVWRFAAVIAAGAARTILMDESGRISQAGFRFARRWWAPLTLLFVALFVLFLFNGVFPLGILAVAGLIWIVAAKFTEPPHEF